MKKLFLSLERKSITILRQHFVHLQGAQREV
jgi:hypothetical protein